MAIASIHHQNFAGLLCCETIHARCEMVFGGASTFWSLCSCTATRKSCEDMLHMLSSWPESAVATNTHILKLSPLLLLDETRP